MHHQFQAVRVYLPYFVALALTLNAPTLSAQTPGALITLAGTPSPAIAQPGVTVLTLVASGIPAGTITPASLTVTLQVNAGSTGPALTAQVSAYAAIPVGGGRITFQVLGANVTSPTAYSVSVSGKTSTGISFASSKPAALTIDPPAQILSMTPSSALPGQSVQVSITGQYTNYLQGSTTANFGSGISVGGGALGQLGPVTVTSPTTAVAQLKIDPGAAGGPRTITMATGIQQASVAAGFSVTAPPSLVSVTPGMGLNGEQNLSVAIMGVNTHFAQGISQASFGAGITVASLSVTDPTHAIANLNIAPTAVPISRTVSVTTGAEIAALTAGFTINGAPILTLANPNTGTQSQQGLSIVIAGQFTHFMQGISQVSFGPAIAVNSVTVASTTSLTAQITILSNAALGAHTISVTTVDEIASLASGFIVSAPVNQSPIISAGVNQTVSRQLVAVQITEFAIPTAPAAISGPPEITVGPDGNLWFTEESSNKVGTVTTGGSFREFSVPTSGGALLGIVTGPDGNVWFTEYFGNTIWRITPAGILTPFSVPTAGSAPYGITAGPDGNLWFTERFANKIGRITPTGVFSEFPIPSANSQPFKITVGADGNLWFTESGDENAVFVGQSKIGRITPSGVITEFTVPTARSAPIGITAGPDGNLWFTEAWAAVSQIGKITPAGVVTEYPLPTAGSGPLLITTGPDGKLWFTEGDANQIGSITTSGVVAEYPVPTPGSLPQGIVAGPDGNLWFTESTANRIARANFGVFYSPTTAELNGSITDDGLPTGASLTTTWSETNGPAPVSFGTATATISDVAGQTNPVPTSATFNTPGTYMLSLSGSDSSLTSSSTVTITVTQPQAATLLSVTPNTAQQGQQNVAVTVLGEFTHFAQSTSTMSFGAGITLASLTVNSATTVLALLNIAPSAAPGPRRLTVTSGNEVATLGNAFTVQAGTPAVLALSPNTGQQGQQNLSITVSGQFTHFAQGATTADFGAGITVGTITVASATSLTALITIAADATPGARSVAVTTGTEVASLSGGFVVSAAVNQRPIVSAGPNQSITFPSTALLNGTISDDGLPLGSMLTGSWSVLSAPLTAGQVWLNTNPSGTLPPPVQGSSSPVFDPITNSLIVFGGTTNNPSNDVWVLSGANGLSTSSSWTQLKPSGAPPTPRYSQAAFYDPGSNRLVVFGGIGPTYPQTNNDVWILTNANGTGGTPAWLRLSPVGAPPVPRFNVGLAYDPVTNRMIVYGGSIWADSGTYYYQTNETWILTNANGTGSTAPTWISTTPAGSLPIGRSAPSVVYDPASNRLITFGGYIPYTLTGTLVEQTLNDTWVLANANGMGGSATWIQLTSDGTSTSPTQRVASVIAYNTTNSALTVGLGVGNCIVNPGPAIGSCSVFSDVWSLKNANGLGGTPSWTQLTPSGGPPTPLNGWSSVYDSANDRLVGFSGSYNDTWILTNATNSNLGVAGTVTFSNPTFSFPNVAGQVLPATTNAVFSVPGSYALRLTGNDSQLSSTSDVAVTVQPPLGTPIVTAAVPNAGQQGQVNLTIMITGQNTQFIGGTTHVGFGSGIAVTSVTVADAAHVMAVLNISANAVPGFRDVTVTTGDQALTLANGFTVGTGAPALIQLNPNIGQQGQQNLSVILTGQFTHFAQGTTTANFGAGVTVTSLTVGSATTATAVINIDPAAAVGLNSVTVTTAAEVASLPNGFSVIASAPAITTVSPNSGLQGQSGPVGIVGSNTHFTQGVTQVSFGPGIVVSTINVTCPTCLTAQLLISSAVAPGPVQVAVTTGSEVVTLVGGFTVLPGVPILTSTMPSSAAQGQTVTTTITGQFTHWVQGTTQISLGAGISVTSIAVSSPTSLIAQLSVDPAAAVGSRALSVTTGNEVVSANAVFTVQAAQSTLYTVNPTGGAQGQQNLSVVITGLATHFVQGTTTATFGAGITLALPLTVNSTTSATATVNIDPAATPGTRPVSVTTGAEVVSLPSGFSVLLNHPPVITSLAPSGPVWENLPSIGGPPRGRDVGFNPNNAYDEANDRLIFFSGDWRPEPPAADVWVLANASGRNGTPTWIQLAPTSPGPAGREAASLTYVTASNRLIVCGGVNGPSSDCWVLTNANGLGGTPTWIRLPDMPGALFGSAAYDEATRSLLVFGYVDATTNKFMILSDADGTGTPTWSVPTVAGVAPVNRYSNSVAYDPGTNRLIMFGGLNRPIPTAPSNLNDLWILTNANGVGGTPEWIQTFPTGGPPSGRESSSFSYDPQTNQALLFGGAALTVFNGNGNDARNDAFSDLWLLKNANGIGTPQWVQLNPVGRKPIGHFFSAFGRDSTSQVLAMALGRFEESATYASALLFTDTWRLNPAATGAAVGVPFTYSVAAMDPDGDTPSFSLTQGPTGMSISSTTGLISYVPTVAQVGSQSVTVHVDDGKGLSATQNFQVLVVPAVAPIPPSVISVAPSAGQTGTTVAITVTCQNANFVPAQTAVFFYDSTSSPQPYAESVTVLDNNTAVVQLNIPPNTPLGTWSFNIGDGFELVRAVGAFTVQATPVLSIVTVSPNNGAQGGTVVVSITGQNTHFAQGRSTVNFGAGITVASLSVNSTVSATAVVSIASSAPVGLNAVTVTTGAEVASLPNGFSVIASPPAITTVSPNSGLQGQGGPVGIAGLNTHFVQGITQVSLGPGLAVSNIAVTCPTCLTVQVQISNTAAPGLVDVTVTTGSEVVVLPGGFNVLPGAPVLTSMVPGRGSQGQSVTSTITGQFTHWTQGMTQVNLGGGITVTSVTVSSATSLSVQVSIDPVAVLGTRTLTVTTGMEVVSAANVFTVQQEPSVLTSLNPGGGQQGQATLSVSIIGQNTHFAQGTSQAAFGPGVTVKSLNVTSSTSATAILSIDPAAELGTRAVTLTTGSEVAAFADGFTVTAGTPTITLVNPNTGVQGQQSLSIAVTGQFTHFSQGTTQANFGTGITVVSLTVGSATTANAVVNIDPAAITGLHNVTLTTGAEVVTLSGGFAIPWLSLISPSTGFQGQQNISLTIAGQFTHFLAGTTQVSFGTGITVNSVTVADASDLTANISIACNAVLGASTILVATGSETLSVSNGFTVQTISGDLLVLSRGNASILRFDTTGTFLGVFVAPGSGGLGSPINPSFGPDGNLYVSDRAGQSVRRYSGSTGAFIDNFVPPGIGGLSDPLATAFGPDGNLYVADNGAKVIRKYNGETKAYMGVFNSGGALATPTAMVFGPDGNLYVADEVNVVKFNGATGAFISNFVAAGSAGLVSPGVLTFGCDNNLYLGTAGSGVLRYAGTTGAPINPPLIPYTGIRSDGGVAFGPNNVLYDGTYHNSAPTDYVLQYNPQTSAIVTLIPSGVIGIVNGMVFRLATGPPVLLSLTPNTGQQGQQNLLVSITGQFTHFTNASVVDLGSGITVSNVGATDATHLVAQLTIATNATLSTRDLTVTTGSEWTTLANCFTVISAPVLNTPALVSATPPIATQGQQNMNVTITGQFTSFVQGTSTASFGGAGVTVNSVTVASATSLTANISLALNAAIGTRTVTVTTGSQIVSLANGFTVQQAANQAPVITIASTWTDTLPNRLTITDAVSDDGLPLSGTLTVSWQTISGPGNVGFQNQTLTCVSCPSSGNAGPVSTTGAISVGFDQPGTYVLQISATDTLLTTTQNVTVTVTGSLLAPPTVSISSPTEGTPITTLTNVVGTVASPALASWTLEFHMLNESFFRPIATGTNPVTNGVLGTFDPTLLLNGLAVIQLRATDTGGQTTTFGPINVVVMGNQKIGSFTVSFNDLTVPVAGLPIQVVRTYDSRNKTAGDFGVGWRLDLTTVTLAANGPLGANWTGTSSGGLFTNYCIQAASTHVVTVTFADGTVFQFQPTLSPPCQQLDPLSQTAVTFTPISTTPLNAALSIVGNNQPFVDGNFPGAITLLDLDDISTFNPDLYQLTMPDGRVLLISQQSGLRSMTDRNGNTLTVSAAGITHSSGKGVSFQRDQSGHITQVTDPRGNVIVYGYDVTNNLVSVKDAAGNLTTFTYDDNRDLLTIVDPLGVQPIRNVYDNSGRLIQHVDAFGNVINYTNNLNAQQEIVTDRLGNVTANYYDATGNIVQVTDALGGNTLRTYDANNNLLTETNPLQETRIYTYDANNNRLSETDPLGDRTTYTYNARNQVLTITDALGHVTTNTYDANGNLISTKDPSGSLTTYTYNAAGLQSGMTDALGDVTASQYDGSGNLTQQTDASGHATTFTYDANGNRLSQTKTRTGSNGSETLLTTYQYDALNRITQTVYPDASVIQVQYNAIGKQSVTTDPLGHQTSYSYDLMGRLLQTTYPDGGTESATYDAEGNRVTGVDRGGRTTTYLYDALKRLTKTIFPDQAATSTTYDGAGEVTAVKDPLGHVTQYQYDPARRRTAVIDALNHKTAFAYDAVGNQTSMTDANGHTTAYRYDTNNRRTQVIYADATIDATGYDAFGRTVGKTDQAGQTTQFAYDKLGQLVQVTDAKSQITKYGYDEIGDRILQTDANSHNTTFTFDKMGRRTGRTLPLGMSESFAYDVAGNLSSHSDFNGKTTTNAYDLLNRLIRKTPDATLPDPAVLFTYTVTGQRQSMTDASGTTAYTYDLRNRLLQKVTPEGTLSYTYDVAGNLLSMRSSNTGGTSVNYAYDALNRLASVMDNRLAAGTTTYSYDNAGNLAGYLYPNGVQTAYTYNSLNRLTNAQLAEGATTLASYGYTLGPTGNRTAVAEFGGRQVIYAYDMLYRLTSETISGGSLNGAIGYTYDPVGNRLTRMSNVVPVPAATYAYDANDRLQTDTYDGNGNTMTSGGNVYSYDFENRLEHENTGAVNVVYDGDGNRVLETSGGLTMEYLVDDRNLTGYAQIVEEISTDAVQRVYSYGLSRISESQTGGTSFFQYDGHGDVRMLTDLTGMVTTRYDYDAFGTLIGKSGSTPNVYLYAGERNDPSLGLYYFRARYFSAMYGRFWTIDPLATLISPFPALLHSYVYASGDPVDLADPSGNLNAGALGTEVHNLLGLDFISGNAAYRLANTVTIGSILSRIGLNCTVLAIVCQDKPDLTDFSPATKQLFEIKSVGEGFWAGAAALGEYLYILNLNDPSKKWSAGTSETYDPPNPLPVPKYDVIVNVFKPIGGVILYQVQQADVSSVTEKLQRGLTVDQTFRMPDIPGVLLFY